MHAPATQVLVAKILASHGWVLWGTRVLTADLLLSGRTAGNAPATQVLVAKILDSPQMRALTLDKDAQGLQVGEVGGCAPGPGGRRSALTSWERSAACGCRRARTCTYTHTHAHTPARSRTRSRTHARNARTPPIRTGGYRRLGLLLTAQRNAKRCADLFLSDPIRSYSIRSYPIRSQPYLIRIQSDLNRVGPKRACLRRCTLQRIGSHYSGAVVATCNSETVGSRCAPTRGAAGNCVATAVADDVS
jgi:hypothetical protein